VHRALASRREARIAESRSADQTRVQRWHALRSCVIALARVNLSPLGSRNQTSRVALRTLVKPNREREREREREIMSRAK